MVGPVNDAVQRTLNELVAHGKEIGVQVCAWLGDEEIVDCWAGIADEDTGRPVDGDTLFNIFSVSKAVSAVAMHMQVERGLVDYDAPVAAYWPEFAQAGKGDVTVRHILSHVSGVLRMPPDVTPELMTNWDWMCRRIAEMEPVYPAGSRSSYQSMTFGWLIGEVVRRTDPKRRPFGQFVKEEIADPLGATDLWLGIDDTAEPRIARLNDAEINMPEDRFVREAQPKIVDLLPDTFERPYVRRACIPAVGGIFNARSTARFFAMLANGGQLNGVRLLSQERVASFARPRPHFEDPDPVFFGMVVPIAWSGFWLGGTTAPPACAPRNMRALCHPGMGGNIGWADPDLKLAVAFCHNRMVNVADIADDSPTIIGDIIRAAL